MGEQDPDFADPRAEARWIAQALNGDVVMVPEAGHYPHSRSHWTALSATDFGLAMATSAPDQLTPAAREIVTTARKLLKEQGIEALSMRRIGQRLGVRAPSIYKHRGGSLLVPDGPSER